jgi:hypothetical protein
MPRVTPARTVLQAAEIAGASALLALTVNAVRPSSFPLVARVQYETLVPCPEPGGPVLAMDPADPALASAGSFLVDARSTREYGAGHLRNAVNVPFDWLEPLSEERLLELARAIAASRAMRVVVYGDGGRPDSGEYLGREISGRGIKYVHFVRGGAPALLAGGG